jgi:transcriptional regulator with PAS, ATPase and Fis domain
MLRVLAAGRLQAELRKGSTDWGAHVDHAPLSNREIHHVDLIVHFKEDESAQKQIAPLIADRPDLQWLVVPLDPAAIPDIREAVIEASFKIYGFIVGATEAMHTACRWIRAAGHPIAGMVQLSVLILGETGTGKELIARAVHNLGMRRSGRFISLNCAALPESLIESELFGNVPGAFTDARKRQGAMEAAGTGTVFLDEIGELPTVTQSRLLRVLSTREFIPLGGSYDRPVKLLAQVLAATNRDARDQAVLRPDLFHRLSQIVIPIPPLRERKEDVPILARHFLRKYAVRTLIGPAEMDRLIRHSWPGNIRELEMAILRLAALEAAGGERLPSRVAADRRIPGPPPPEGGAAGSDS